MAQIVAGSGQRGKQTCPGFMQTILRRGRIGLYSWMNPAALFERVVVTDPTRRVGKWEIADQTTSAGPSSWRALNGSLRQRSGIGEALLPSAPGAIAFAGDTGWSDYRLDARLRSDVPGAIGVVFRWRDTDNWYRLSLDARRGQRRLVKCSGDSGVSVIWEDTGSYDVGKSFSLTIDAIGSRFIAHHDDEMLFDLIDTAHAAGRVGLYCSENTGARFERVTVTSPPLDTYAVFRDNFNSGDLGDWVFEDEESEIRRYTWQIANGALRQTSALVSDLYDTADLERCSTQALAGDADWGDIAVAVRLKGGAEGAIGVTFRYRDSKNFYRFVMDHQGSRRRVVRAVDGDLETLWEDGTRHERDRSYDLLIALAGARANIWLDGIPLTEVEDSVHAKGQIGLYCFATAWAEFSSVRVFTLDVLSESNLLSEEFDREVPGRWAFDQTGFAEQRAVWAIADGELRQSADVAGIVLGPAAELLRPGPTAIFTQPRSYGRAGITTGSDSWTDYRISVRLRSDDDDDIGVLIRYQDEKNWYRYSMSSRRGYRRLVRYEAGVATLLWSDVASYEVHKEYLVTLDVVADAITGYLDGVPLFSVRDAKHASGTIGLYCCQNTGARFFSVRVTEAQWSSFYRFGLDEEQCAPGTRVALHSGNETDWNEAPKPGVKNRFAAALHDSGRRRLSEHRPVMLRWRNQVGEVGHTRRFLPTSAYAPAERATVLRKADGTEAAIFMPAADSSGSVLTEGQYRLRLTYRRDNTASQPDSLVLSRGGDRSDEVVVLDVPWSP